MIDDLIKPFPKLRLCEAYLPYFRSGYYYAREYGLAKTAKGVGFLAYKLFRIMQLDLSKERTIEVNGMHFCTIPGDIGISAELLVFQVHEPLSTRLVEKELSVGDVCLDVGANIGYYALLEKKTVGKQGKVVAVEPVASNFQCLKKNIRLNGLRGIVAIQAALLDEDGTVNMVVDQRSNLCSVADDNVNLSAPNVIRVHAESLDNFVKDQQLDRLDFVRMDTEGCEALIYAGGRSTLRRLKPRLFIEVHQNRMGLNCLYEYLTALKKDGYDVKYFIPRELNTPLVCNQRDVQELSINDLLEKTRKGDVPNVFHLFLVNSS
jgi:FkbM family methyltransferase